MGHDVMKPSTHADRGHASRPPAATRAAIYAAALACLLVCAAPGFAETTPAPAPHPEAAERLLSLWPDSAALGAVCPSATCLQAKAHLVAARCAAPESNPAAALDGLIAQWARDAGLDGAKTLPEIALACGLDPDEPSALFLDVSPAAARAQEAIDLLASGAWWKTTVPDKHAVSAPRDWVDFSLANAVVVTTCREPALAGQTLQRMIAAWFGTAAPAEEPHGAVIVHTCGPMVYAFAGNLLFVSNSSAMLDAALNRMATPKPLPKDIPAGLAEKLVLVSRLDRLRALSPDLAPLLLNAIPPEPNPRQSSEALRYPPDAFEGEEPCITTIEIGPERIEYASMYGLAAHPKYAAYMGKARRMHLAALLPEDCRLLGCVQWNEAFKGLFQKRLMSQWKPHAGDLLDCLRPLDTLAGESAIGIAPGGDQGARVFFLAEVPDTETLQSVAACFGTPPAWEEDPSLPGIRFAQLAPSLCVGIRDKVLLAANGREAMTALAHAVLTDNRTRILESRTPSIDPATEVYGLFSLQTDGLATLVAAIAQMLKGESDESLIPVANGISERFREIRAGKVALNGWHKSFLTLYFR